MGGNISRGKDNQSLIDTLKKCGPYFNPDVERVFRLVDRGDYFEDRSPRAYMDLAWRSGSLHLSAPNIYVIALTHLELQKGHRFLNVGSGTGYFSTVVGLILGYNGVNHGIESNAYNVSFARKRLTTFMRECDSPYERDFCVPDFVQGNVFDLLPLPTPHSSDIIVPQYDLQRHDQSIRPLAQHDRENVLNISPGNEHPNVPSLPSHRILDENASGLSSGTEPLNDSSEHSDVDNESTGSDADDVLIEEHEPADSDEYSQHIITANGYLSIEPPPLVAVASHDSTSINLGPHEVVYWPTYDRIYVGSAITSQQQLEAILRLLKVGGILVAPVQSKFLKIMRISEHQFHSKKLMSVSFSSLVVPHQAPAQLCAFSAPSVEVPCLEQLCSRIIRSLLRQTIEYHHKGVPQLGRLERKKKKRRKHGLSKSDVPSTSSKLPVDENNTNSRGDNGATRYDQSGESRTSAEQRQLAENDNTPNSPAHPRQITFLLEMLAHGNQDINMEGGRINLPIYASGPEFEAVEEDRLDGFNRLSSRLYSRLCSRRHERTATNTSDSRDTHREDGGPTSLSVDLTESSSNNSEEEEEDSDTEVNDSSNEMDDGTPRKRPKRETPRFIPASYVYCSEMRKILMETMHLPEHFVRSVLTL